MKSNLLKKIDDIKRKANMLLFKIDEAKKNKAKISKNDFEQAYKQIKEDDDLIEENYKTINEQLMLIDELTHLKKNIELAQYSDELVAIMDFETYFDLTISNEIDFNEDHPYYRDIKFIKKLIDSYIETEEYEKCAELIKLV
jgi:hypothetical protein